MGALSYFRLFFGERLFTDITYSVKYVNPELGYFSLIGKKVNDRLQRFIYEAKPSLPTETAHPQHFNPSCPETYGRGKSLGELSLREVAGEAGIVPAAFYRHFKNMEELGLALVDDMSIKLRTILREARKKGAYKTALQESIALFFDYVKENRLLFRFISRERTGGNKRIARPFAMKWLSLRMS